MSEDGDGQMYDPRRAGMVRRYHTWPHIRPQTVAEHTWHVLRILLTIWPQVALRSVVTQFVMFHDCGEFLAGDPPYPSKRLSPDMAEVHGELEQLALNHLAHDWGIPALSASYLLPEEYAAFKLAEMIEMWEWGQEEVNFGNRYAVLVVERCWADIARRLAEGGLPVGVGERAEKYVRKRKHQEETTHGGPIE